MLTQIPLSMGAPEYKRSSPRDLVYSVATAKNPDGSKKYKLDIALNTLVTKVQFNTSGERPQATGVEYLFGESLYRADPRASDSQDGGVAGSVSATREVSLPGNVLPRLLSLGPERPRTRMRLTKAVHHRSSFLPVPSTPLRSSNYLVSGRRTSWKSSTFLS